MSEPPAIAGGYGAFSRRGAKQQKGKGAKSKGQRARGKGKGQRVFVHRRRQFVEPKRISWSFIRKTWMLDTIFPARLTQHWADSRASP